MAKKTAAQKHAEEDNNAFMNRAFPTLSASKITKHLVRDVVDLFLDVEDPDVRKELLAARDALERAYLRMAAVK